MAALSANPTVPVKTQRRLTTKTFVAQTSEVIYDSALVGLDSNGDLVAWADTAGHKFAGIVEGGATTGNDAASPPVRATVRCDGPRLIGIDVAGVDDRDDLFKLVYCSSDNTADLTLTPSVNVGPVGRLIDWRSNTDMDVELFTLAEGMGVGFGSYSVLNFSIPLANLADGDIITTWTPGFAGRIVKFSSTVTTVASTASKASTLNLEIGTTNLTGGVLALTTANCDTLGETNDATAITAANYFNATDTISLEASSTTAFIEGVVELLIVLQSID